MRRQPASNEQRETFSEVEMVITAPESYAASLALRSRARMTLGALTQMISRASHKVLLTAPYIQEGDLVGAPLYLALESALEKGIDVDVISTLSGVEVIRERIGKNSKGRLRYFRPQPNVDDERRIGSHAKVCVCDNLHAYVGSANLTIPGLSENLEMGLLVHGKIARQISEFWALMIDQGLLVPA